MLSCESGMHIASFQDGTSALPDLEYAKGINKLIMKFNSMPQFYLLDPNNNYCHPCLIVNYANAPMDTLCMSRD